MLVPAVAERAGGARDAGAAARHGAGPVDGDRARAAARRGASGATAGTWD